MTKQTAVERIDDIDIQEEMESSFLEYAYSVIYSRALPDARDGLKPVQRRILFMMTDMGLRPEKGHVKSARVVGEVMGKLHPHGDSSIYDALVRLAQPFAMRLPLVDGHGNFGSLDDGPAASRYTEARLTGAALAMTSSLDEDVVDFIPNYDNQLLQPEVLPSAIPNLLVNGASGIAVGMATNLAPHNLIEVVDGAKYLLDNPDATVEDLMQFIPGPDLPGGATIVGLDGIVEAYTTGKGAFKTRAKVSIEQLTARKVGLVVTELPYLVGPERVIEKIKQGVEAKRLSGITEVTDLTDRKNGLRLVITVKTGFSAEAVLEQLYKHTPLEDSFSINSVALVDGQPQTLGLIEMLRVFLTHRTSVIRRRSEYRLQKRLERLHLVEGLLIAILDIDEVIQLIRTSDDTENARIRLKQVFELSDQQAEYILELRLRRLTKFSRLELEAEQDQLRKEIEQLKEILESETLLKREVSKELDEVAEKYGTPRRTVLTSSLSPGASSTSRDISLEIADTPCVVLLSANGKILRIDSEDTQSVTFKSSGRTTKHGALNSVVATSTRGEIAAILSTGMVLRFSPVDLPAVSANSVSFSAGVSVHSYLGITERNTTVVGLAPLEGAAPIGLFSAAGVVKRTTLTDLPAKQEFEIISLKDGDKLVSACEASDTSEFVAITSDAQLLRFSASAVRPQGRQAGGMAGMKLSTGARVIFASAIEKSDTTQVVTVAKNDETLAGITSNSVKISDFSDFPTKGRATGGVRAHRFLKGEHSLSVAWVGAGVPRALSADGTECILPTTVSKRDASGTVIEGAIAHIAQAL